MVQEVTYWYQHTGSREELMLEIIDEFNSTNEWGITVVGETQGGYNDLYQKIIAGIPANQLPTMAVAYQNQAATYAVQEVLVNRWIPTSTARNGVTGFRTGGFLPHRYGCGYPAAVRWPLRVASLQVDGSDVLQRGLADGIGLRWSAGNAGKSSKRWRVQRRNNRSPARPVTGSPMGYVYSVDASRFATFVFSRGGNIIAPDGSGYAFGDQAGVDALTFWQGLTEKGCAKQATERYGDQTDFGNGYSLFTVGSISGLPYYGQAVDAGADFEWSVNPPPHSTAEPRMNIYGASQSIFVSTPEAAVGRVVVQQVPERSRAAGPVGEQHGLFPHPPERSGCDGRLYG